jgi:hypothetical protein
MVATHAITHDSHAAQHHFISLGNPNGRLLPSLEWNVEAYS